MNTSPDDTPMGEADILCNLCGDLVSLTCLEPALLHLFRTKSVGEWVGVKELYAAAGSTESAVKDGVVAAWLRSPDGDPGGAIVLFLDTESLWSMAAWYNVGLLREKYPAGAIAE